MLDDTTTEVAEVAASTKCGSVVAAAGCGKTEQIARATQVGSGRRLILTHTHAGMDALSRRLQTHNVPKAKYHIDTIASWCLRYAASFPTRSGLRSFKPRTDDDWNSVYGATEKLLETGALNGVVPSSYIGVFVDEYQDCSLAQHQIITSLASHVPVCVFGDPLQAIFDFNGKSVDWITDVFPTFAKVMELTTPWRWKAAGNDHLAKWLAQVRTILESGGKLDLTTRPSCVKWERLPSDQRFRQGKIVGSCKTAMGSAGDGQIVVIGDAANLNSRASLAQKLAALGFSNIEPISCKALDAAVRSMDGVTGQARLDAAMKFIGDCMIGADKAQFLEAVKSRRTGGKRGTAQFGDLIGVGIAALQGTDEAVLELMNGFQARSGTQLFRREMFFAMRSALRLKSSDKRDRLDDALWEVQNQIRHAGRRIGKRSIGSTLLVKGLEFEHAVIIHSENMSRKEWYVALTRATTGITILSEHEIIVPPA